MRGIFRSGGRRAAALAQLVLFAFSASTSLLPCGDASAQAVTTVHVVTPPLVDATNGAHEHQHQPPHGHNAPIARSSAPDTSAPPSHEHQRSHDATCPWVVGCIGMAQLDLDDELRTVERLDIAETPAGVVMQHMMTDREIESPPPRI